MSTTTTLSTNFTNKNTSFSASFESSEELLKLTLKFPAENYEEEFEISGPLEIPTLLTSLEKKFPKYTRELNTIALLIGSLATALLENNHKWMLTDGG